MAECSIIIIEEENFDFVLQITSISSSPFEFGISHLTSVMDTIEED